MINVELKMHILITANIVKYPDKKIIFKLNRNSIEKKTKRAFMAVFNYLNVNIDCNR
jgi:hypothetical protein